MINNEKGDIDRGRTRAASVYVIDAKKQLDEHDEFGAGTIQRWHCPGLRGCDTLFNVRGSCARRYEWKSSENSEVGIALAARLRYTSDMHVHV